MPDTLRAARWIEAFRAQAARDSMPALSTARPDPTPYVALRPQVPLTETNPSNTAPARLTRRLDLTAEDRADESLFNQILWRMIKGARRPMPPPRHRRKEQGARQETKLS